jgi:hypothetical protein
MKQSFAAVALGMAIAAGGAAALTVRAQVTAPVPGVMTQARVWIQNRGQGEAVPVSVEQAGTLTVRLAGPTNLTLAPGSTVGTQAARQAWDYETVRVAAGQDAAAALGPAGQDGWEAVGVTATDGSGATILMKRPR